MKSRIMFVFLLVWALLMPLRPASAQEGIQVSDEKAILNFPESVIFQATLTAQIKMERIVLEYGADQLTCGTVIAKAFPTFSPSTSAKVSWTWEMRQSGSLPPGATLWWRWRVTDVNGQEYVTPQQTITWLDDDHDWKHVSEGGINLHYYGASKSFAQELHSAAVTALNRLKQDLGIQPDKAVDIYIYANTADMRSAILYEPGWAGGLAFPEHNIVIIGVSAENLEWGKRTVAHELTHVLVGHRTFSCLGSLPTWVNEGLAMYGEGGPEDYQQAVFEKAIEENSLLSLRSLSGGFSEESERANLSYTQSYSVIRFLIETYGRQKMDALLTQLSAGETIDSALQTVYGLDVDGLEDAWRAAIGASPRAGGGQATPRPTATMVPTIAPIAGVPAVPGESPTPLPAPRSTAVPVSTNKPISSPTPTPSSPLSLPIDASLLKALGIALACLLVAILAIGGPILVTTHRRRRKTP